MINSNTNETKRTLFAKANPKKLTTGVCKSKRAVRGLVLDKYKLLATGTCVDKKINNELNNVIIFNNQKEVA
jgi:hypothetical protein